MLCIYPLYTLCTPCTSGCQCCDWLSTVHIVHFKCVVDCLTVQSVRGYLTLCIYQLYTQCTASTRSSVCCIWLSIVNIKPGHLHCFKFEFELNLALNFEFELKFETYRSFHFKFESLHCCVSNLEQNSEATQIWSGTIRMFNFEFELKIECQIECELKFEFEHKFEEVQMTRLIVYVIIFVDCLSMQSIRECICCAR